MRFRIEKVYIEYSYHNKRYHFDFLLLLVEFSEIQRMNGNKIIEHLSLVGIRPTATRILIYQVIQCQKDTFSLRDIEDILLNIDKSTIFRTLILFEKHNLIHSIEDGSGAMKYCLNRGAENLHLYKQHCHFYCEKCKKTYCLESNVSTMIPLPTGFSMRQINYTIKGTCDKCSSKNI